MLILSHMTAKIKTRYFQLNAIEKSFVSKMLNERQKNQHADLELLRNLLTKEKAKILYTIKQKNPHSIYHLAMLLNRDQKSIRRDLKILERFGFVDFEESKNGKKISHKPVLTTHKMILEISI
jgi:predicted transcriptional regulator